MTTKVFRNNPDSVGVTTGSILVSSNQWWRVSYHVNSGELNYNGSTLAAAKGYDTWYTASSTNVTLSIGSTKVFDGVVTGAGASAYIGSSNMGAIGSNNFMPLHVRGPATISLTSGSGAVGISGRSLTQDTTPGLTSGYIWAGEGVTISGSGTFRLYIEKYS